MFYGNLARPHQEPGLLRSCSVRHRQIAQIRGSLPAVDASIAAAWIGAGVGGGVALLGVVGTVVTSVVSSNNTRKATERTVQAGEAANRATLTAARDDRLWEKRCAVYEETLMEFQQRQARRRFEMATFDWNTMTWLAPENPVVPQDPRGWPGVHARLVAYATDEVLEAFQAISSAEVEAQGARADFTKVVQRVHAAKESGRAEDAPDKGELVAANEQLEQAIARAQATRERMIEVIRGELRSKPEAALQPVTALPAVRRRFWQRRRAVDD